jgi:hypothetical protein
MALSAHPAAPHHLPGFMTVPGETDALMVGIAVFLVITVLVVGTLFLRLHTLPERIAHKGHKLQFEIVAVLGLLALFTHVHLFWVAGLLLALIDLPDFSGSFARMAWALEKIAGNRGDGVAAVPSGIIVEIEPEDAVDKVPGATLAAIPLADGAAAPDKAKTRLDGGKEPIHA